jgi:UDP-N-acetylmuramoyl-L-alanyl-D-glutamate--2,6-diaminopimelate ligase
MHTTSSGSSGSAGHPTSSWRPAPLREPQSLGELTRGLPVQGFGPGWERLPIRGLVLNSREAVAGDLFCAVQGEHTHGIRYWPDAEARGAVGLLVDADTPVPRGARGVRAVDVRTVLAPIAERLYGHPGSRLRLTGVTGTNGKTTTVQMVSQILAYAGFRPAYWSTAWVAGGPKPFRPTMTTPDAPRLQGFLREAVDHGATDAVLEVSSHGVVLNRLGGLRFHAGVATNITPDHLDFHGTFDAYRAAKERFIAELPPEAVAVLNADDPVIRTFAQATRAQVRFFGWGAAHDAGAVDVDPTPVTTRFRLVLADRAEPMPVTLPVPGRHNVLNALAAILVARHYGIAVEAAVEALGRFVPPVRRLEPFVVGPYTVINDVAMNRASYETVLASMDDLERPLVVVNAIRGNRGVDVNREIAAVLATWDRRLHFAPVIVSTSDPQVSRLPVDYRVRPEELEAFLSTAEAMGLAVSCHRDLVPAIAEGVERLKPGGVLLLLGTFGMDDGPELAVRLLSDRLHIPFTGLVRADQRGYGG